MVVTPRVHFYGLYETWKLSADGTQINDPALKIFHGVRAFLPQNLRWTVAELGVIRNNDFDKGEWHIGTQLEVTF